MDKKTPRYTEKITRLLSGAVLQEHFLALRSAILVLGLVLSNGFPPPARADDLGSTHPFPGNMDHLIFLHLPFPEHASTILPRRTTRNYDDDDDEVFFLPEALALIFAELLEPEPLTLAPLPLLPDFSPPLLLEPPLRLEKTDEEDVISRNIFSASDFGGTAPFEEPLTTDDVTLEETLFAPFPFSDDAGVNDPPDEEP